VIYLRPLLPEIPARGRLADAPNFIFGAKTAAPLPSGALTIDLSLGDLLPSSNVKEGIYLEKNFRFSRNREDDRDDRISEQAFLRVPD